MYATSTTFGAVGEEKMSKADEAKVAREAAATAVEVAQVAGPIIGMALNAFASAVAATPHLLGPLMNNIPEPFRSQIKKAARDAKIGLQQKDQRPASNLQSGSSSGGGDAPARKPNYVLAGVGVLTLATLAVVVYKNK